MKKIIALLLVAVMVLATVGCAKTETKPEAQNQEASSAGSQEKTFRVCTTIRSMMVILRLLSLPVLRAAQTPLTATGSGLVATPLMHG